MIIAIRCPCTLMTEMSLSSFDTPQRNYLSCHSCNIQTFCSHSRTKCPFSIQPWPVMAILSNPLMPLVKCCLILQSCLPYSWRIVQSCISPEPSVLVTRCSPGLSSFSVFLWNSDAHLLSLQMLLAWHSGFLDWNAFMLVAVSLISSTALHSLSGFLSGAA